MNLDIPEIFFEAAGEYKWMLSKGYPQKASLKLVGDKHKLPGDLRQVLYRGICSDQQAVERNGKIGTIKPGDRVLVDVYNVLFSLNNYLLGKPVFICNDGLLRDAGEMRGRIVNKPVFSRAISLFLEDLKERPGITFMLYLDEPVSYSGRLSIELSKDMVQLGIDGEAQTVRSADQKLKNESSNAICTSDSAIIDRYTGTIMDLPRFILEKQFDPQFLRLDV